MWRKSAVLVFFYWPKILFFYVAQHIASVVRKFKGTKNATCVPRIQQKSFVRFLYFANLCSTCVKYWTVGMVCVYICIQIYQKTHAFLHAFVQCGIFISNFVKNTSFLLHRKCFLYIWFTFINQVAKIGKNGVERCL